MFTVVLEEVASCMGGDEREVDGAYATYEEALARCRALVDQKLQELARKCRSVQDLWQKFQTSGVEPFIDPPGEPPFIAAEYAQSQCRSVLESARQTEPQAD